MRCRDCQDPTQWGVNIEGAATFSFGANGGLDNQTGFLANVTYEGPNPWS